MATPKRFLVLGATGRTAKHFVAQVLRNGHQVRALVRDPSKLGAKSPNIEVIRGSIADFNDLENLVSDVVHVILMLGDAALQSQQKINTLFLKKLIPAIRLKGAKRL